MSDLFTGRALFHCHTRHTDGQPTAEAYVRHARALGLDRVVFLEHIRRGPSYDVPAFVAEAREAGARHGVPVAVGFEAKVLPGGDLDIEEAHLALAEVIGIAEHAFPADVALWEASLRQAFARAGGLGVPAVWVHPGLRLRRWGLLEAEAARYEDLIEAAQAAGLFIEQNRRYGLLPEAMTGLVRPSRLVRGADAHRLADVDAFFGSG